MTPTEAALGLREWFEVFRRRGKGNEPTVKEFLEAADLIEKLDKRVPRWISVEERLPEQGVNVPVIFSDGFVGMGQWLGWGWFVYVRRTTNNVTHWMPLPTMQKEDAK